MATTPYTPEDQELLTCLPKQQQQLRTLISKGRPYVWELRLSLEQYYTLETALDKSIASHSDDYHHLLCKDFAIVLVMYLAEWYKRFYKGTDTMDENKVISLNTEELKKLYQLAGIDANTFVYNASKNSDKTSFRWLESLQVLGGLAVQAELKRDQSDALLPQLCKIFHGEEIELSDLRDRNRAVAFQESIARQHSLYEYLDCILSKDREAPFAKEDLNREETCIPQLLSRILEADEEAKKDKFDFEWVIAYTASRNQMVRHLRVKLKPEEIGGGKRQYIGYDRLQRPAWGIDHPEEVGRIRFYLRFKNEGRYVQKVDETEEPLFKYDNTGSDRTGFLSVNKIDENTYTNIPVQHFDKVEMVMKYSETQADGASKNFTRVVQELAVKDYMQVYALPKTSNKFSTRKNAQAATAVIYSSAYHLAEPYKELPTVSAHFRNGDAQSEDYNWCPINDKVILIGPDGKEVSPPFFNRNGLYQVLTKKYLKTIKYQDNVFVIYRYIDTDYDEEEMQEDSLPVLFGRSGLEVRHYATGSAKEGEPVTDYDLEWLKGSRYVDWKDEEPEQGAIRLRVTVKGIVFKPRVYYVPFTPSSTGQQPIWRDFEHMRICTMLDGVDDIQDSFEKLLDVREPSTKQLKIGNDRAQILVDVYRPIIMRELSQKDQHGQSHIVGYAGKDEDLYIPLITCDQFSVRDFSEMGVKEYAIEKSNRMYYGFPTFNDPNLSTDNYKLELPASMLTEALPLDYLKIYLSKAIDAPTDLYAWNYKTRPVPVANSRALSEDGIVFQSLKDNPSPRHYALPYIKRALSGWGGKKSQIAVDALYCFETVAEHGVYYFLFNPLIKTVKAGKQIGEIFLPLVKKRGYQLTDADVKALYQLAVEFHFDWMLLAREAWSNQIAATAEDESEAAEMKAATTAFFQRSPKSQDEREARCLKDFVERYWTFDTYPNKINDIAIRALRLILGEPDALGKYEGMRDFLKDFDECRYKYSEMSRAIVTNEEQQI